MALKSLTALAQAIADVKKEAGDNAEYKSLVASLDSLRKELGSEADVEPAEKRDSADDDYSFATAEKRHVERNSGSAGEAAPQGGESK